MAVSWTEAQADAISARKGSVLVAAAAGSSETAVLVQRAIERLTDPSGRPGGRMQSLPCTSPKAAAAEMQARLERRLYEMLRDHRKTGCSVARAFLLSHGGAYRNGGQLFGAEMVHEFFHVLEIVPEFKICLVTKQREDLTQEAQK